MLFACNGFFWRFLFSLNLSSNWSDSPCYSYAELRILFSVSADFFPKSVRFRWLYFSQPVFIFFVNVKFDWRDGVGHTNPKLLWCMISPIVYDTVYIPSLSFLMALIATLFSFEYRIGVLPFSCVGVRSVDLYAQLFLNTMC